MGCWADLSSERERDNCASAFIDNYVMVGSSSDI